MARYAPEVVELLIADAHAYDRDAEAPTLALEFVAWMTAATALSELPARRPAHRPKGSRDRDPDAVRRRSEGQRRRQAERRGQ